MHPQPIQITDYFVIGSFDDLIIQQAKDTYIKSVAKGYKFGVNRKTAMKSIIAVMKMNKYYVIKTS